VYDRSYNDQELNFEASGALEKASLVMRDRETNSWWSIMSSKGIGGELDGAHLEELPVSEKSPWGEWKAKHPNTLVLSVDGVEHDENNPYDNYFGSDGTFRGIEIEDLRLPPKESIYSFWYGDKAHAIANRAIEGGALVRLDDANWGLFYREADVSVFASSQAYRLTTDQVGENASAQDLLAQIDSGELEPAEAIGGFDTYWYNWVIVNPGSELLEPARPDRSSP
jgi:Protein of unknown function (DUF3179)